MSKKLFVGGLAWEMTDQDLQNLFAEFGNVEDAKVIMDRDTGRSRGFGFVTLGSAEDANQAISSLDGSSQFGRSIRVNLAEDKQRGGNDRRGGGGRRPNAW